MCIKLPVYYFLSLSMHEAIENVLCYLLIYASKSLYLSDRDKNNSFFSKSSIYAFK